ncbi:hypothetical protein I302_101779 [Kwoniella bestiolae CBS 10118]|uniref:BZIP domain-containing protein n=1 Tax=Kwoniella bestiolae CBS 10118 TaxID=1296100 RepID=A0A1B9GD66_9TREE|nr:hypothetical protein I302_00459 [Kwoniella bestiolae CBS 10118]OCF28968.1 hypothetical protein I302_00459 [Kwoniella bestiolae CBS 10118]
MRSFALCSILATLSTLSSITAWTPTETQPQLAPRTFQSMGMTCYSECPATRGSATFSSRGFYSDRYSDEEYYTCNYSDGSNCWYNDDGSLNNDHTNGVNTTPCPGQAPSSGCGTPETPSRAFKRSTIRKRTTAEKRLAARQYNPKKAKRARMASKFA